MKKCSDFELVEEFVKHGNKNAFNEIFERHFEITYRFIYSRVGNKTWAEDITSETFFTLLDVIASFDGSSKLKSFVIGIALNKIRQFWYEISKRNELSIDFDLADESILEPEEQDKESDGKSEIINEVLNQLPENYKQVLVERFINRKSIKVVSEDMKISEDNVSVLQHRALKKAAEIGKELRHEG